MVEAPIGRHPVDRKKMAVITDPRHRARPAVTGDRDPGAARADVASRSPPADRSHTPGSRSLRHTSGHPVVGDPVYGGERRVPSQGIERAHRDRIEAAVKALGGRGASRARARVRNTRDPASAYGSPIPAAGGHAGATRRAAWCVRHAAIGRGLGCVRLGAEHVQRRPPAPDNGGRGGGFARGRT